MEDEKEESLFRRVEAWTIEWDLHIWYAFISVIALCVLLFIVGKEFNKTSYLTSQLTAIQEDVRALRLKNQDLIVELDKQRQIYLSAPSLPKDNNSADKAANKVSEKIDKVQDVLIDKATQPKVIKTTETTLVPTPTIVNKELNTMMFESYCSTVPDSPKCKADKKK